MHEYFKDDSMLHWKINGYINKDEILCLNFVNKDFYYLDQTIKQYANDKKYIPGIEKLEIDLPVLYITVPY